MTEKIIERRVQELEELLTRFKSELRGIDPENKLLHSTGTPFRKVFRFAPLPILFVDSAGLPLEANQAFLELFQIEKEQIEDFDLRSVVFPESTESIEEALRPYLKGLASHGGVKILHTDGSGNAIELRIHIIALDSQGHRSVAFLFEDLTAHRNAEVALEQSDTFYEMVSRVSQIGGWRVHLSEELFSWTGATAEILGRSSPPTSIKEALSWYADDYQERISTLFASCAQEGEAFDIEVLAVLSSGGTRWVRTMGEPVFGSQGDIIGVQGALQDITAAKEAREILRENEERFRLFSHATSDALWDWNLQSDNVWWSSGFQTLFGFCLEDLSPHISWWTERVHPEDRERILNSMEAVIVSDGSSWTDEYRFQRPDGSYAYVLDRAFLLRNEEGVALRMIGGISDLTEQRNASARLAEQAQLLEEARDAIELRDLKGHLRYVNRQAEELYGWKRTDVLGKDVRTLHYKEQAEKFEEADEITLECGRWTGEMELLSTRGEQILIDGRWSLLRREDGTPYSILAINTDIREKRHMEAQLIRSQRLESIGTLAGGIAHDLNNVLTPILFSLEMLKENITDLESLEDLNLIEACAQRGSEMIQQLLSFARGYMGQRTELNLSLLLHNFSRMLLETFPKNLTFDFSFPDHVWPVRGDTTQINQLLMNLCVNARDAMPAGGLLSISIENIILDEVYAGMHPGVHAGSFVLIRVEDTGEGISPQEMDRIFEPFFTTRPEGTATGLGLSTSHAIVKSHGGFIDVYSKVELGSQFHVYLPASTSLVRDIKATSLKSPTGQGETILVVDDEKPIREMVKRTLERFGYRVLLAEHGAEATAIFARSKEEIDLVLTDMAMPIMDGAALIQALLILDENVKIISSSGLASEGISDSTPGNGVRSFIAKPYSADLLLRTLRKLLDQ